MRVPDVAVPGLCPRLLDLGATAAYLGVSGWTVRDLEAAGELRRVRIPVGPAGSSANSSSTATTSIAFSGHGLAVSRRCGQITMEPL